MTPAPYSSKVHLLLSINARYSFICAECLFNKITVHSLTELNDCIRGLFHLELNVITFRTLLHLGQLLRLGSQHTCPP